MSAPVLGADPAVKLIKANRFLKAIAAWDKEASKTKVSKNQLRAIKGQAQAYRDLGSLYNELHEFSLELNQTYYNAIKDVYPSSTLDLYRGQVEFYLGNYKKSMKYMDKAMRHKSVNQSTGEMAKVYRHFAHAKLTGKNNKFLLNSKSLATRWQIAEFTGDKKLLQGARPSKSRPLRNYINLLIQAKTQDRSLFNSSLKQLLKSADQAETILNKGKLTQVDFSDPYLFKTISNGFYYMGKIKYTQLSKEEKQFPKLAKKFRTQYSLAEVEFRLGNLKSAQKILKGVAGFRAKLLTAKVNTALKNTKAAKKELEKIAKNKKLKSSQKRDVGHTLYTTGLNKELGKTLTRQALKNQKASMYHRRHASILFSENQKQKALEIYAKGYKIQFRNSVEHIEPEYMIEYARAIFNTSKLRYDEVIETLFHIQKAYPACRQLHYSMQGIAAAEAKTFQSEKIFKKGG